MLNGKRLLKMAPIRCYNRFVTEALLELCPIETKAAVSAVRSSRFYTALKEDPQMVMHDSPDEWAESVANQFNLCRR
ncbi:hypothetical protein SRRS_05140 [Sporomusa rhizae]|uniref:hypothetical protein n=1 Tax=Sporomusa rhizae TaxID=357999 RepID=UPI00352B8289